MALTTTFGDGDATATVHAQHHNDMATMLNTLPTPIRVAGWYYDQRVVGGIGNGNFTPAGSTTYFLPTYIPWTTAIDRVGTYVTIGAGAGSGVTLRFGLYAASPTTALPTGSPTDFGTVDMSNAGAVSVTVSTTFNRGWCYLAIGTLNIATGSIAGTPGTSLPFFLGSNDPTPQFRPIVLQQPGNGGAGVLPTSPPTTLSGYSSNITNNGTSPLVSYRCA